MVASASGASAPRRSTARMRAVRTRGLNGFVTYGCAHLQPGDHVGFGAFGSQHDDRDRARRVVVLKPPAHFEPVHARQHQVEHDDIGQPGPRGKQGLLARGHHGHVVALLLQVVLDEFQDVPLIVDDEYVLSCQCHILVAHEEA